MLSDPAIPSKDLLNLLDGMHEDWDLVLAFTVDAAVLDLWSMHPDPFIRAVVAFNPATAWHTVEELARDSHPIVRVNAVFNQHLTRASRVRMARHDPDPGVRDQATWAMRSQMGRAIVGGMRWVGVRGSDEDFRLISIPPGADPGGPS